MTEHEASRTLVKSPPELWSELSDESSLASHLAEPFGEIRITRLEPETTVAWEGERASGTVRIEPSGWGTRVILTAVAAPAPAARTSPGAARPADRAPGEPVGPAAAAERTAPEAARPAPAERTLPEAPRPTRPVRTPEPSVPAVAEPRVTAAPPPAPRTGFLGRVRGWFGAKRADPPEAPALVAPAPKVPAPVAPTPAPAPEPTALEAPPPEPAETPRVAAAAPVLAAPTPTPAENSPPIDHTAVLVGVLDRLGAAHHRPFSRN